jgi:hypothetical protein
MSQYVVVVALTDDGTVSKRCTADTMQAAKAVARDWYALADTAVVYLFNVKKIHKRASDK